MNINFKNKLVLITGSTQGIGFEIGNAMLNLGANVIFNSRSNNLKQLKKLKQSQYKHIIADVSDNYETKKLLKKLNKIMVC